MEFRTAPGASIDVESAEATTRCAQDATESCLAASVTTCVAFAMARGQRASAATPSLSVTKHTTNAGSVADRTRFVRAVMAFRTAAPLSISVASVEATTAHAATAKA